MPEFDEERFDELILYIAEKTKQDENFGRVKLAKVLFYADFDAYRDGGESITGATYIRMPFGPFPRPLEQSERRLAHSGRARFAYYVAAKEEKKVIPLKTSSRIRELYEAWQLLAVDGWIDKFSARTARRISDDSHLHSGWIIAQRVGDEIPYSTAFLPEAPPSALEIRAAKRIARDRGWLTDVGWKWERGAG